MMFKFIEMLYQMYGDGYIDQIDDFAIEIANDDMGISTLFIEWANYIKESDDFKNTL